MTSWMIEAGAPNGLLRRGFTKSSLPPGTEIVVEGWQAKDGPPAPTAATSPTRTAGSCSLDRREPARLGIRAGINRRSQKTEVQNSEAAAVVVPQTSGF